MLLHSYFKLHNIVTIYMYGSLLYQQLFKGRDHLLHNFFLATELGDTQHLVDDQMRVFTRKQTYGILILLLFFYYIILN